MFHIHVFATRVDVFRVDFDIDIDILMLEFQTRSPNLFNGESFHNINNLVYCHLESSMEYFLILGGVFLKMLLVYFFTVSHNLKGAMFLPTMYSIV